MKVVYRNLQVYDATQSFSVSQRRLAFMIKKHPRAFCTQRGPRWQMAVIHGEAEVTPEIIALMESENSKNLMGLMAEMQKLAALRRRLGLGARV